MAYQYTSRKAWTLRRIQVYYLGRLWYILKISSNLLQIWHEVYYSRSYDKSNVKSSVGITIRPFMQELTNEISKVFNIPEHFKRFKLINSASILIKILESLKILD